MTYIQSIMLKENTFFGPNIKLLRQRRNSSQEVLANALDLKRSTLSGYENGTAEPSISLLGKFSDFFQISIDNLVKQDLSKLSALQLSTLESGQDIDLTGNRLRILATTVDADNEENIEAIPEKAKAGYRNGYADPEYLKVLPTFQLPFLSKQKKYRSFPISGDSMPPVSDGSYVVAEYIQNWNSIKDGQPYIILTKDEGIVFKIVYNRIHSDRQLLLCSTNPFYEPYCVEIKEVLEVWKFVNYICPELPEPNLSKEQITDTVLKLQKEVSEIKNTLKKSD